MSSERGGRRKEDRGDNERNLFLFPGLSCTTAARRGAEQSQTSLSTPARMRGDGKRTLAEINKQLRSSRILRRDVQPLKHGYF